jgi:hypothetical protein
VLVQAIAEAKLPILATAPAIQRLHGIQHQRESEPLSGIRKKPPTNTTATEHTMGASPNLLNRHLATRHQYVNKTARCQAMHHAMQSPFRNNNTAKNKEKLLHELGQPALSEF